MKERLLFKVTVRSIIVMFVLAALNIGMFYAAAGLKLPFWFDTIGTMTASMLFGPLGGIITGVISSFTLWLATGSSFLYSIVAVSVGLVVGLMMPCGRKYDQLHIVSTGMLTGVISSLLSIPLNFINNGGGTGNVWGDALKTMLERNITAPKFNTFASVAFIALPDRVLSAFTALFLIRLVKPWLDGKHIKNKKTKKTVIGMLAALTALSSIPFPYMTAKAESPSTNYEVISYNSWDGILHSSVNAVTQTPDGYLWVGTYSGLYVFDGVNFEKSEINDKVRSVRELAVDSKGRLWIGTTESGIVCYDSTDNSTQIYNTRNGLGSDYVRSICEDTEGNIYVGTSLSVSKIMPDGKVKTYHEWRDILQVQSLEPLEDGGVIGVTNSGSLFLMKNDLLLDSVECPESGIDYHVAAIAQDTIYVGTDTDQVDKYIIKDDKLKKIGDLSLVSVRYCNRMKTDHSGTGIFFCCETGHGYIDCRSDRVIPMTRPDYNKDISDVCADSQGNIWFASSKQGLVKYAVTPFKNLLHNIRMGERLVNAVMKDGDIVYVGTDVGLYIIDLKNNCQLKTEASEILVSERIRQIFKDSKGNIWISSYGSKGLVRIAPDGDTVCVSSEDESLSGLNFRMVTELSDGTLAASTSAGLVFLRDGKPTDMLAESDGLNNKSILSLYEREDGTLMAGSDGDGIYMIKNDKVAGHIGVEEGLESKVVMRMVPCSTGFLYVTSNGLYCDEGGKVRLLENFPYYNNFDIIISEDRTCYITSSAGLFIVPEDKLLEDGEYSCSLLDSGWGLNTSFTSNSWNVLDEGTLYLCCTEGVRMLDTGNYGTQDTNYQMHLKSVKVDGKELAATDGKWVIPSGATRIILNIAVNNLSQSNPKVHYYLKGSKDEGITCYQNEITPLTFTDLPHGKYELHIDILDNLTGEVIKEEIIPIEKEALMYEYWYFKLYLMFVIVQILTYFLWVFATIYRRARSIRRLQREISTDPMTGLLNKSGSVKALEKACAEDNGVLMMIDLDSFKLVNDIYGHEMGDRILIRFAELINEALGEENIRGRMGGDEFVGFMRDSSPEEVEEVTKMLNRELVISAKQFMGEDMNIPIGTSIGAVKAPADGTDFHELFKLADKALYVVKQNGKHGCAFYQENSANDDSESAAAGDLSQIMKIIGERNEGKGAFCVSFDKLQVIYKYLARSSKVRSSAAAILRFALGGPEKIPDEIMDDFEDHLIVKLKKNDVVSRYAGCFFVLLNDLSNEDAKGVAVRISEGWEKPEGAEDIEVSCEMAGIGE